MFKPISSSLKRKERAYEQNREELRDITQVMGVFFMSLALGNLVAGLYAGEFDTESITANPDLLVDLFGLVAKITIIGGIVVLIFSKPIRKLMGDIR